MKTLYLDCHMGAAGDMLAAALLELIPEPEKFLAEMNALGIPGVSIRREPSVKCGITGTHLSVLVHGEEEESYDHAHDHAPEETAEHSHSHSHAHSHTHHHTSMHEITHLVQDHLALPETVRADVLAVYRMIAEAESHVHGVPVEEIHFHEVGTWDAVADIVMVCSLIHRLSPEEIVASAIHVGSGQVHCAHGILPVPAPATAYILRNVPIYSGEIRGELCTPTGAALLCHFVHQFGTMPVMRVSKIGYGMGTKDFAAANCVRAMLGETSGKTEDVLELSCNVDDMTAEEIAFATEQLLHGGALDVYTVPAFMKKGRLGTVIRVLCMESERDGMLSLLFRHTTTLGVRESILHRYVLNRNITRRATALGTVRCKEADGYGVRRFKYEYDDMAALAREKGCSLREILAQIEENGSGSERGTGMHEI